jgi:putative hydrolase of the HAD superfamily
VNFPVQAITLDLDDTLWPFAPIGARIEQVLHDWMREHSPATAAMYPVEAMRELRERLYHAHPHLHHDLSALRRLTLHEALHTSGASLDLLEPAYEVFYAARNQVECYPDAIDALARIAARVPVAALSNGNADLERIGLAHHFAFQLGSREHGAAKPEASIFHAACTRLGVAPAQVLHVGDHADMDVAGAMPPACAAAGSTATQPPGPIRSCSRTCSSTPLPAWPTGWMPTSTPPHPGVPDA